MAGKYLVTGGTGFIGRALVRALVNDGQQVTVLDNQSRGSVKTLEDILDKIDYIEGDIRDAACVDEAVAKVDSVFHLAFVNGTEFFYTKPDLVLEVGVKGMTNVIDACVKHNTNELFVASSSEVYQNPLVVPTDESAPLVIPDVHNPRYSYAGGKLISELLALNYGRERLKKVVIFRPHNVYGPNMGWEHVIPQFVVRMKELCDKSSDELIEFPIQGTGKETRAFCYIDDFINGLMILKDKGEHQNIYHIGTQHEVSIEHVAEAIGSFFGREIRIVPSEITAGSTPRRCPNVEKIKALGYESKVSFLEGLTITANWYKENIQST